VTRFAITAQPAYFMRRPVSELAALQHRIDVALRLALFEAVSGNDLSHQIVPVLERGQILRGELVPLGSDFLADNLPGRVGARGATIGVSLGGCLIR
jgi:hypothetical protein